MILNFFNYLIGNRSSKLRNEIIFLFRVLSRSRDTFQIICVLLSILLSIILYYN